MAAIAQHRLPGGIRTGAIFDASFQIGSAVRKVRNLFAAGQPFAGTLVATAPAARKP